MKQAPTRPWSETPHRSRTALQDFIDTVDCTGGPVEDVWNNDGYGGAE